MLYLLQYHLPPWPLPKLLAQLNKGLDSISAQAERRSAFFDGLMKFHAAALKGDTPIAVAQEKAPDLTPSFTPQGDGDLLVTRSVDNACNLTLNDTLMQQRDCGVGGEDLSLGLHNRVLTLLTRFSFRGLSNRLVHIRDAQLRDGESATTAEVRSHVGDGVAGVEHRGARENEGIELAVERVRLNELVLAHILLHVESNGLKLLLKEVVIPAGADKSVFLLAPVFAFCPALIAWAVFGETLTGLALVGMGITVFGVWLARK